MDVASLQARIEELTRENAALRADHEALLESRAKVVADRDRLQQRVAELEVCNRRWSTCSGVDAPNGGGTIRINSCCLPLPNG